MAASAALDEHGRLLRRATSASVATAALLAAGKAFAFWLTGSISILASLVDSLMDCGASLITAFAVRYSQKPADNEHRFGHGKSEALAGLMQSALIVVSALFLIVQAIRRFLEPRPLEAIPVGIAVMLGSLAATLGLVLYQRRVVRVTGSSAIRADSLHYLSDLATNLTTLAALGLSAHGLTRLDPVLAVVIALSTLYAALRIGRDTLSVLMDHELPEDVQEQIRSIARGHAGVLGVHDLRTHQSGTTKLVQLHLEMDGHISLLDAHRISDEVERAIRTAFPGADVVIHEDPAGLDEKHRFP